jgi:hypothetical protein
LVVTQSLPTQNAPRQRAYLSQTIPQHAEVPPNIEAILIFYAFLPFAPVNLTNCFLRMNPIFYFLRLLASHLQL